MLHGYRYRRIPYSWEFLTDWSGFDVDQGAMLSRSGKDKSRIAAALERQAQQAGKFQAKALVIASPAGWSTLARTRLEAPYGNSWMLAQSQRRCNPLFDLHQVRRGNVDVDWG